VTGSITTVVPNDLTVTSIDVYTEDEEVWTESPYRTFEPTGWVTATVETADGRSVTKRVHKDDVPAAAAALGLAVWVLATERLRSRSGEVVQP